ncbi:MAG: DEAD/DEAH box helicase, partial [Collinsella bouchesdurhonensis]|nr:DEAD/DEAH box helicase [Collinsella bouchesdurhonensis]
MPSTIVEETNENLPAEEEATVRFADLGLSDAVMQAVVDMGYETPTPVQAASIPEVLAGRDILAAAQTGTGKTAAFLLPTMSKLGHVVPPAKKGDRGRRRRNAARGRGPLMLVITPTRELAQQIDEVCTTVAKRTGHTAVTVVGGLSYGPQKQAFARGCDILVATPGRLVDLIEQGAANLDEVGVLVLDEADRMLDMGFLPQVRTIVSKCREERQTLLFSATLDEERVGAITDLVHEPARVEIAPVTSTADTVDQYVVPVSMDEKNALLAEVLKKEGPERVIVFVRTKRRADTCVRRLARSGFKCEAIHGDRSQGQRQRALAAFRDGRVQVLVATDVLARGIDVSDVRYVVNFDVPEEPTDYIHRIGRTGRAGEEGWSLTFVTKADIAEFFDIEALMGKTADMYDATGLTLGTDLPRINPDRVPADHAATKNERKRRKQKEKRRENAAKRAAAKRGD